MHMDLFVCISGAHWLVHYLKTHILITQVQNSLEGEKWFMLL